MTVTLSFFYRDSAPGGGPCADEAACKAEAAKVAREVLESFNPSAEGTDELIRTFLMEAAGDTDDDARLYEDERLGTQDLDDDEALALAAEDCGFTWECLPGEPASLDADALRQALETALTGVAGLLANWERGDLAGQVHALQGWAEGTFEKFPDLDAERWIAASDLRPGDLVDMEGVYAEDTLDGNAAEFEYCRVIGIERERPDCVRVDFADSVSFGFDPDRFVKAVCTAKARAEWADPEATKP